MYKKIICAVLALVLIAFAIGAEPLSTVVSAATAWEELESEIEAIDSQIAANEAKLKQLKNKAESQKEYLDALEDQIEAVESKAANLQTQLDTIDSEIDKLNNEIKQLGNEISAINDSIKQAESDIVSIENNIEETSVILSAQLRSAYINGDNSGFKILMGADSLASFLTGLEMMKRTSENTKATIEEFKEKISTLKKTKEKLLDDKEELNLKKTELDEKKSDKVSKKAELKSKQAEYKSTASSLEAQYSEIEEYIAALDKSGSAYQAYIAELEQEKAAADAELDRVISEYYATSTTQTTQSTTLTAANVDPDGTTTTKATTTTGASYNGSGKWYWPLGNASCYISSGYGYRSASISGNSFHGGVDITGGGISGKPVYASRGGTVITAVTSNTGYGIYVVIDHGDGFSTVYAHMSTRYVSTGDKVSQGQMIGRVGSTGNSTGPHLHFEVRSAGVKKNPLSYVKKP